MAVQIGVLGPLEATSDGTPLLVGGAKPRAVLTLLSLHAGEVVSAETLVELLWGDDPPRTAAKSLQTHISALRRVLGEGVVVTRGGGWALGDVTTDAARYRAASRRGRTAARAAAFEEALAAFDEALHLWRGAPDLPDTPRGLAEATRWREAHDALVEDRADAQLATGRSSEIVGELEVAVANGPLRERRWTQLILALYRAGRQADALRAYQRARTTLADELGVEPGPELRRLEARVLAQDPTLDAPAPVTAARADVETMRAVTFLLTDIEGSTAAWEGDPKAMAAALRRHDELIAGAIAAHGGRLVKARGEGDATFSVFERPTAAAAAAADLQARLTEEDWATASPIKVRVALHTGEAEVRDGDYFGRTVNRVARLRSLARGGQILLSRATADLVADDVPEGMALVDLGQQQLKDLPRPEHVFELANASEEPPATAPFDRPPIASALTQQGPFVGRDGELQQLSTNWDSVLTGTSRAVFIAGEPGVGKTRLAAEWVGRAHQRGAAVLYGRCDEDLGAPYQPFAEALRSLVPSLGPNRLRSIRGLEELARVVPELTDILPDLRAPTQADPDTERYVLFDAVVRLLSATADEAPVVLVLDDLHWAAKPTLLLLRHVLRFGERASIQIVGTYRSTDLGRAHPLAGTLADLHRDGTAERIVLPGLGRDEVTAFLDATGYQDDQLAPALTTVTAGNPFFLIEVLRHVDESGGEWDPSTLPQGVREAVWRRLTRLSDPTNDALLIGAVAGSSFALDLVERVAERDLTDAIDEACRAGIVIEEPGGSFRFNHALVRQSLLAELASVKRIRLHRRVAEALEATTADGDDSNLADLAYHYFECAWAGGADKAVDYCRRAGEQAAARLAYEAAADLYDRALQATEVETRAGGDDERAELLLARCEALLAAGDATAATTAVTRLEEAARTSPRLSAWATCFAGQLAVLTHPERLDTTEQAVAAAAQQMAAIGDDAGEAQAHTVRASCLSRLGRVADCEAALDRALTAARRAGQPRRVNAVLAGAPLAALWGPSPVARASGRCLDVVRVLRITTGSPAVEATALRCQAVLEALRGRTDAARRMLGSARRSLESLGHTHGLLEVNLFAGLVELLDGDAPAAEVPLRRAYQGFVERGVGVDAAQAAAVLARAVLAQDRIEEAVTFTEESKRLAGVDLKAAISWRAARAEALARQGRTTEALEAARAAVDLADPTDALIDQGDARFALAVVLRAAGEERGAEREARRAIDLYERKGAIARVAAVQQMLGSPAATAPSSAPPSSAPARRRVPSNRATQRLHWPVDGDVVNDLLAMLSEDFSAIDHRFQLKMDRRAITETWRLAVTSGRAVIESIPLATLGGRHCLARYQLHYSGRSGGIPAGRTESDWLSVLGVDTGGLIAHMEQFGPDDLGLALARLIELHADNELPPAGHNGRYLMAAQGREGVNHWADDAVLVDRRPASLGTLRGREAIRAAARALEDVTGGAPRRFADVLGFTERVVLVAFEVSGRTESDEPFELPILSLGEYGDDGLIQRAEWYLPEQIEEALARFDELTTVPQWRSQRRVQANAAIAIERRTSHALQARDLDAIAELVADDYVQVDHDHLTQAIVDREAYLHSFQMISRAERVQRSVEPLATLGEWQALSRVTYQLGGAGIGELANRTGDAEIIQLNVMQIDEEGRIRRTERFDQHQLGSALARLIELFADEEPARRAGQTLMAQQFRRSLRWADDAVLVDHRPASLGTLHGRGAIRDAGRALDDVTGGAPRRITDVLGFTERIVLVDCDIGGRTDSGEPFELPMLALGEYREDGLLQRAEWYLPEQVGEALARFDELTRKEASDGLTNEAVRHYRQVSEWQLTQDWEPYAAHIAPDAVVEDRRRILTHRAEGRDAVLAYRRSVAAAGVTDADITPLATRGETLALFRTVVRGSAGEAELLDVHEFTADGTFVYAAYFDAGDIDAAFDELDRRYLAGEAAPYAETLRPWFDIQAAYHREDWERVREVLADGFTVLDHRPPLNVFGAIDGPDDFVEANRVTFELSTRVRARVPTFHAIEDGAALFQLVVTASTRDGADTEICSRVLYVLDRGQITLLEYFPDYQLDAALARFNELIGSKSAPTALAPNAAATKWGEFLDALLRGDLDASVACCAEDAVFENRRHGVGGFTITRREATEANIREMSALSEVEATLLATRGERLAVRRVSYRGEGRMAGPFEDETLNIEEVNHDGLISHGILFDPDDVDAAFDELDRRYLAGEGNAFADALTPMFKFIAAYNSRDWDRCRRVLADEFKVVDHRPPPNLYGVTDGPDAYIGALRVMDELTTGMRLRVLTIHALGESTAASQFSASGSTRDGADIELAFHILSVVDRGRTSRLEYFPDDQLDAALARFDELTHPKPAITALLPNSATAIWEKTEDAVLRGELDALVASCAEDIVYEDRRPGVGGFTLTGKEPTGAILRSMSAVSEIDTALLATRGDRLELRRLVHRGEGRSAGPFEVETLRVEEVNHQGLRSRAILFDPDELDAAFDELDARYLAGEGAPFAESLSMFRGFLETYNRRDWGAFRSFITEDATIHDHRPAGWGRLDRSEYIVTLRGLVELTPDVQVRIIAMPRANRRANLGVALFSGTDTEGGDFEIEAVGVLGFGTDRIESIDLYAPEDLPAALARFEQLTSGNAATRLVREEADRMTDGDLPGILALHADHFLVDDRRSGVRLQWSDASAGTLVRLLSEFLDGRPPEITDIATRGDRLGLFRVMLQGSMGVGGEAEIPYLQVEELDAEGRASQAVYFDPGDLVTALKELDDRYTEQLSAEEAELFTLARSLVDRYNRRDWDGLKDLFAEDAIIVDDRMTGWGTINVEDFLRRSQELIDMVADANLMNEAVGQAGVTRSRVVGTMPAGGGPFELVFDTVATARAGKIVRLNLRPPGAAR